MNESSVSSPFMKDLREYIPGAIVIKHNDASMIGLPDCSVHYKGLSYWFEFKLWIPTKEWSRKFNLSAPIAIPHVEIAEQSPTQLALMRKLNAQATDSWYIFWVNKTKCILLWNPVTDAKVFMATRQQLVQEVGRIILGRSSW